MVEPTAPLAHRASDLDRLHATEVPFLSQIDVRCGTDAAARLGFPLEPNTVAGDMVRGVLWLGPDEWLVVGLPGTGPGVLAQLEAALTGSHASVVDTSANRAVTSTRRSYRRPAAGYAPVASSAWKPRCAQRSSPG